MENKKDTSIKRLRSALEARMDRIDQKLQEHSSGRTVHLLNNVRLMLRELLLSVEMDVSLALLEDFPIVVEEIASFLRRAAKAVREKKVDLAEINEIETLWIAVASVCGVFLMAMRKHVEKNQK